MRRAARLVRPAAAALATILAAACGAVSPPASTASSEFWKHWGDGKAELSGYDITTDRYGQLRKGHVVLIYVTEPMDRRTWIKDDRDGVPPEERVNVLKLNHVLRFRAGIYPYSVMTSVFAPVDGTFPVRFSPGKISFSAQEWCGTVDHQVRPAADAFRSEIHSYFSAEGDAVETVPVRPGTLYEDALLIQLRELDGPFSGGKDWEGDLVPSLWALRKAHARARPVPATIRRTDVERGGVAVTRFTLSSGATSRTIDVEKAAPRRILGWTSSDGEEATLLGTDRLPYWELNRPGDESALGRIGLKPECSY